MSGDYQEESRRPWSSGNDRPNTDQIKIGCMQRIATATEAMSKNYVTMENNLKWSREHVVRLEKRLESATNTNRSLRGHITRLKKKLFKGVIDE